MNTKLLGAFLGGCLFVGVVVAVVVSFGGLAATPADFTGEFSAAGSITGSDLVGTPADLGDGTFAVYFARDEDTKDVTFELTASAKGDDGSTYFASAKDGKVSLWTTGDVEGAELSELEPVDGFKMFECDDTAIHLQSWSEQYAVSKAGNIVTLSLGDSSIFFTLGDDGVPAEIRWGGVLGSVETFAKDSSLKGMLGKVVPAGYPCLEEIADVIEDAAGVPEVSKDAAQDLIDALGRRLTSDDEIGSRRRLGSSLDYQMILMAKASYELNDCGTSGWHPWFAMQKDNAYAQVCWSGQSTKQCTLAFRGSDDGSDWYSNIIGGMQTGSLAGYQVPQGFLDEYEKVKSTSSWTDSWEWAKSSEYCSGGIFITGHSLGAAMAQVAALDGDHNELYTFAAPKGILNAADRCGGKRYFIENDPVPGLPPWGTHSSTGYALKSSWNWFSKEYSVENQGCGSNGGGGFNPLQHGSGQYEFYIDKTVG